MADEVQVKTGVEGVSGSPTETDTSKETKTPTVENTGVTTGENKIPQSRFNEVIQQRNELEARLQALEKSQSTTKAPSIAELEAQRLAARLGAKPEATMEIINTINNLRDAERQNDVMQRRAKDAKDWAGRKAKEDADYDALGSSLDKEFSSLSKERQFQISADPDLLEMFYGSVKAKYLGGKVTEAFNKGKEDAYKTKATKEAMSTTGGTAGSGGKTALTMESIVKLTPKEQMERQAEVNEFLRNLGSR